VPVRVHVVGVGNGSLKVDDADKGYTGGPSTSNRVASGKPGTQSLHQKLAAG